MLQCMSPVMTQSGHVKPSSRCPLSGANRKTFADSELLGYFLRNGPPAAMGFQSGMILPTSLFEAFKHPLISPITRFFVSFPAVFLCGFRPALTTGFLCNFTLRALHVRKVTWHLPLELGEVARDHRYIEASENRLLWLAIEQETEGRLKTALGRMFAGHQPLAHFTGHGGMVTSLARSFTNDHFETERAAL